MKRKHYNVLYDNLMEKLHEEYYVINPLAFYNDLIRVASLCRNVVSKTIEMGSIKEDKEQLPVFCMYVNEPGKGKKLITCYEKQYYGANNHKDVK